jgi:hypothetical protein
MAEIIQHPSGLVCCLLFVRRMKNRDNSTDAGVRKDPTFFAQ